MLEVILKDIKDVYVRENFARVKKFIDSLVFSNQTFKVFFVDIKEASDKFTVRHGLKFIPEDVIVSHAEGDFDFYFRYQEFDRDNLYITAAGPVKIKFLAGTFDVQLRNGTIGSTYPLVPPSSGSNDTEDSVETHLDVLRISLASTYRIENNRTVRILSTSTDKVTIVEGDLVVKSSGSTIIESGSTLRVA